MRNGLNITGVSESVHEYRDHPQEAIADFRVTLPLDTGPGAAHRDTACRTRALRTGTLRVARDFTLHHSPFAVPDGAAAGPAPAPTAYESALAAVAACVLITKVNGYTARGVSLGSLRVTARGRLALDADGLRPLPGVPLTDVRWSCAIDCEAPAELLRSVTRLVAAFSPNHQALLDNAPFTASVHALDAPGGSEPVPVEWAPAERAPADGAVECLVEADAVWEYGSEAVYTTSLTVDGRRRRSEPLTVDQAKQMVGIDKGPNSQEILLSAVSAEVAALLVEEADRRCVPLDGARLTASGRLDTRGMLNVVREVPSRFHALTLGLGVTGATPQPQARDLLRAALARAVVPATLLSPLAVDIELLHRGHPVVSCTSTLSDTEALRDEITRRQAAAADQERQAGGRDADVRNS
ncbi:OsmC family protein [Streptomyces sp. NPDC057697]|uniref:OsmC family protein n=1 Tax=Streptomyces sp. NPDC057697 TaxID=3346219 RepID=UPI003673D53C